MSNASQHIVNTAWNFAHVLRDNGLLCMAHTEHTHTAPSASHRRIHFGEV